MQPGQSDPNEMHIERGRPRCLCRDELADALTSLSFEVVDPDLELVASWLPRRLTSNDAAYVALAELRQLPLIRMIRQYSRQRQS